MQKLSLIFNTRLLFYLTLFLFIFIPLYPKFPIFNIKGTFVAVRLEDLIIAISFLLWGAHLFKEKKLKELIRDKIMITFFTFFFIGFVSLHSAFFITHSINLNLGLLHFLRRIELMLLLPFVFLAINSKRQFLITLKTLAVVLFLVNVYAMGQQFLGWPVVSTTNSEFSKGQILYLTPGARVNSTFAGHYDLAVFLVMMITISAAIFFAFRSLVSKLIVAGLGVFSFVVLVMTAARLSFVAVVFGVVMSFALLKRRLFILLMIMVAVGVLLYPSTLRDRFISTITVNILNSVEERYQPRTKEQGSRSKLNIPTLPAFVKESSYFATSSGVASDITPGEPTDPVELAAYRSLGIRLNIEWPRALNDFYKNPLLGTGYSSIGIATDNDFLRSLAEVGILGTLAFGLIHVAIIKRLFKIFRKSSEKYIKYFAAGTIAMIFSFLINAVFIDVFEASKVASLYWMLIGLALSVEKFND